MEKYISRIVLFMLCCNLCACGTLGSIAGQLVATVTAPMVEYSYERQGLSKEDARNQTKDILSYLGANTQNTEAGLNYMENRDKTELFSSIGHEAGMSILSNSNLDPELKEKIGNVIDATKNGFDAVNDYNKKSGASQTFKEKQEADKILVGNLFDAAATAYRKNEEIRRQRRIAEKQAFEEEMKRKRKEDEMGALLNIPEILSDNGMPQEYSNDINQAVFAVQESNEMTPEEKEAFYKSIGLNVTSSEIDAIVVKAQTNAENVNTQDNDESNINAQVDAERNLSEQKRIERISTINTIEIEKFSFNETELSDNQKIELDAIILVLNEYPDTKIIITGHTCNIGTKLANEHVGLRRAESAKNYLVVKGISSERISTVSAGDTEPIAENNTPSNRTLNRRLTFNIK